MKVKAQKEANKIERLSKEAIFLQAGVESIVHIRKDDLKEGDSVIGVLVHCPFWLNRNQTNFIRLQFQDPSEIENTILSQVIFYLLL